MAATTLASSLYIIAKGEAIYTTQGSRDYVHLCCQEDGHQYIGSCSDEREKHNERHCAEE